MCLAADELKEAMARAFANLQLGTREDGPVFSQNGSRHQRTVLLGATLRQVWETIAHTTGETVRILPAPGRTACLKPRAI